MTDPSLPPSPPPSPSESPSDPASASAPSALSDLLGSKKNVMALLALLCALAAHLGLHFTPDQAFMWVSPFLAAILGQGIADHGKERALVETRAVTARLAPLAQIPSPPTASLKVVGAGASLAILFLLALGAASSHGCAPATKKIATEVATGAGDFLACEKVQLEGYVTVNGKSLPLISAVANDLASGNYDALIADLVTQLGRDAVGCATIAIADVEAAGRSAPDGIASPIAAAQGSPFAQRASATIEKYGFKLPPPARP